MAGVRLILLTSLSHRGPSSAAHRAGCAASLLKPIRASQLYDCLVTAMGLAPAPAPLRLLTHQSRTTDQAPVGVRVLVAEDNMVNQRLAVRLLEKLGCRVDVVANGREAVEASSRIPYDCVFMDCQMPEMDGYAATAVMRQREVLRGGHLPIIAITANTLPGDRERCLAAGMDDYVSKPVHTADVVAMLHKWAQPSVATATPSED